MMNNSVQARKILSIGYLAHVVSKSDKAIPRVKDTLEMQEFLDVFLDNLLELALEKEIEFNIKLALNTVPISKALYNWP